MIELAPDLILAAQQGSRPALETLVRSAQQPVFNLAMRMLADAFEAEDATQEILIKMVTRLGDLREPVAAGAWVLRIACRHLVHHRRQSGLEARRLTFRSFADDLADGLEDLPDDRQDAPETLLMIKEVKIGCTMALLTCMSRPLRVAYVLGEIFELSDLEAAAALEIEPPAFRQRLRRARNLIGSFLRERCGILNDAAPCRCSRRVIQALALGRVASDRSALPPQHSPGLSLAEVEAHIETLEQGQAAAVLMRSNPDFATRVGEWVLQALDVPPPQDGGSRPS